MINELIQMQRGMGIRFLSLSVMALITPGYQIKNCLVMPYIQPVKIHKQ